MITFTQGNLLEARAEALVNTVNTVGVMGKGIALMFKERFAAPNELIGLSRELEVTATHKVKRGERLQSGERTVQFSEEHTNGKGEAVILPGVFMISVPAFLDGAPVRIPARLRYRIQGGSIHWSYGLYRAEHWLRNRVKEDMDQAAKATALPAFEGAPEA